MRVGRNETCPCGSGKKYKVCCEGKHSRATSRGLILLFAAMGVIAAVGVFAAIRENRKQPATTPPAPVARATPKPQPPGPAPAGKVWSAEHGHWHDQAPQKKAAAAAVPARAPKPQPPGPAPAGQVWSAEHGHWHDARTP